MDRFEYVEARLFEGELYLKRDNGVRIYDGDDKSQFANGEIVLTSHRLLWGRPGDIPRGMTCLALHLSYIFCIEEESGGPFGFGKAKRIVLHLNGVLPDKNPGPAVHSPNHHVKLSFKDGININFQKALGDALNAKAWVSNSDDSSSNSSESLPAIKMRTGIVGIERGIQEKQKATDESISVAFQDLNKLMAKAKDMVSISKTISTKIREKQGDISEDDTVRFKSYLMSLGIEDPVTRDSYKTNSEYYRNLAQQVSDMLVESLMECGGMMSLADVWCRVNRARGLELISPEDLLNACRLFADVGAPMSLRKFPSGACVIQLNTHDDNQVIKSTLELLEANGFLTPEKLSQLAQVSVLLAKERLLTTERAGAACRDESIEGLSFYPNRFLTQDCE